MGNKWQHLPRHEVELDCSGDGESASCPEEPPQQRQRVEDPLSEHLRGAHQEAFHRDLDLVQCRRQTYFIAHSQVFHKEATHDLANVFGEMAKYRSHGHQNSPNSGSVVVEKGTQHGQPCGQGVC